MKEIKTWKNFAKHVRDRQAILLKQVSKMSDLIFIAGCQRSGTTLLTNVLMQSPEIENYLTNLDSELEGALMLSGNMALPDSQKRFCFQTTYLNEKYKEYFDHIGRYKLVFVVRNPISVAYSMIYHWKRKIKIRHFALNELFFSCGKDFLTERERKRFNLIGTYGFSSLRKACSSYNARVSQIFEIMPMLGANVMVIEYDDMIRNKDKLLPIIFSFFDLKFHQAYTNIIHSKSLNRAEKLPYKKKQIIMQECWEIYEKAIKLAVKSA